MSDALPPKPEPEVEECNSCGFVTDLKPWEYASGKHGGLDDLWMMLCDLCANTLAGNASVNPQFYSGQAETMSVVCYVGNVILQQLRKDVDL